MMIINEIDFDNIKLGKKKINKRGGELAQVYYDNKDLIFQTKEVFALVSSSKDLVKVLFSKNSSEYLFFKKMEEICGIHGFVKLEIDEEYQEFNDIQQTNEPKEQHESNEPKEQNESNEPQEEIDNPFTNKDIPDDISEKSEPEKLEPEKESIYYILLPINEDAKLYDKNRNEINTLPDEFDGKLILDIRKAYYLEDDAGLIINVNQILCLNDYSSSGKAIEFADDSDEVESIPEDI